MGTFPWAKREFKKNENGKLEDAVLLPNLWNLAIVRLPCAQMPSALQKDFLTQEKKNILKLTKNIIFKAELLEPILIKIADIHSLVLMRL